MKYINTSKKILALISKGNTTKAIKYQNNLIIKGKNVSKNSLILSEIFLMENDIENAIAVLEKNIPDSGEPQKPFSFEMYKALGDYYYRKNDLKNAFRNLRDGKMFIQYLKIL